MLVNSAKFSWVARYVKEHAKDSSVLGKDLNLKRKLKLDPMKRKEFITNVNNDVNVNLLFFMY